MTEVTFVPRVKTETETIQSPVSKCGDNWWREVKVRVPYRGTDRAFRHLPSLGDPAQLEQFDHFFPEEMIGDYHRISEFTTKHAHKLSDRQRANIDTMLARASRYTEDALRIQNGWTEGFSTTHAGNVPKWPLGGQPATPVNRVIEEGHARDSDKWKKLIRAALRNLRCAEEVAKKGTIRFRNMERRKLGRGGRRFGTIPIFLAEEEQPPEREQPPEGERMPSLSLKEEPPVTSIDPELEEGDIELEEEDGEMESAGEEPPIPKPDFPMPEPVPDAQKKATTPGKKDNTILIVGAAALGILALARK